MEEKKEEKSVNEGVPVTIPMPGLLVRIIVKVGDRVKAGDNIAVMEAMKMEIELPSPLDGRVRSINYKKGDSLARGDILAVIGD
jgi:oxaloacetate decarboxylase alpha subunit/pyruvate carboxylase subunit B